MIIYDTGAKDPLLGSMMGSADRAREPPRKREANDDVIFSDTMSGEVNQEGPRFWIQLKALGQVGEIRNIRKKLLSR